MKKTICFDSFDLHLFDGASGGAEGGTGESTTGGEVADPVAEGGKKGRKGNPLSAVKYGVQEDAASEPTLDQPDPKEPEIQVKAVNVPNREDEFEKLIKGEYKEAFSKRTQSIIDSRFKETKVLQEQMDAHRPVLDMIAQKYGVDVENGDYSPLLKAIEEDDTYYEQEAIEKGMTVDQLKQVKKMERENIELRRSVEERQRQERAHEIYQKWIQQGEEVKQIYPSFDFDVEMRNQNFVDLIKRDVDVKTAFEVTHKDEIIGGAMQFTASEVAKKMAQSIASKAARPQENGTVSQPGFITKTDVNSLTKKDREEVERRVARGEKIRF